MVTKYEDICAICGRPRENVHHLVFGMGLRSLADADDLRLPLCSRCHREIHDNAVAASLSKMLGQVCWEKENGTREEFRERYGRSYL